MQPKIQAAGLPWFAEDDYEAFRSVLPDRRWHRTFHDWETAAQQTLQRLQNDGIRAVKAQVRSAEFIGWCRTTGRDVNTQGLQEFANLAALRAITGEH
jgi:hypothetical protein